MSLISKPKPLMLVSCPKSGTDFLMKGILTNRSLNYSREFFNSATNSEPVIQQNFGYHLNTQHVASEAPCQEAIDLFNSQGLNITKENYLAFRLEHFIENFDMVVLHRSRSLTFPSTIPEFIGAIGISFLHNNYVNPVYTEIQKYFLTVPEIHRPVISHVLNWYVTFKFCDVHNLEVIDYEDLMTLDVDALDYLMQSSLPDHVYKPTIARRLVQIRKVKERPVMRYSELNSEPRVEDFLKFLQSLSDYYPVKYKDWLEHP
jgi:hypothetical protein